MACYNAQSHKKVTSAYNAGDLGLIPGSGRSTGEGNGNPLQYSCLENLMDGGGWWPTVHGVTKSQTRLSDLTNQPCIDSLGNNQNSKFQAWFPNAFHFGTIVKTSFWHHSKDSSHESQDIICREPSVIPNLNLFSKSKLQTTPPFSIFGDTCCFLKLRSSGLPW